ncbi:hypothetical protein BDV37DRAFT_256000 [Aspergillus pseudonomiae]|uniref:Uncharacterized protein n=1 Tax=Aspergillus pseudonomiae TaxID=1506151 RepID=A0A5N7D4U9_9EURO|nr:uncharacterized protein BDV37DRAFT_256000 [Aspergillus pseudonomiae]KAE8401157.1 hypothetical protein BDV37DRAFT_256000 [Aspergillus pseudonomiae]
MFGTSLFVVAGALIAVDSFSFLFLLLLGSVFALLSLRSSFGSTKMDIFLVANIRRNSHYSYYLMILLGTWHRY